MFQHHVPARVGLLGNPSDLYGGRTLALAVADMVATVSVLDDEVVRISGPRPDPFEFESIGDFAHFIDRFGYGTGEQLLAATLRTFLDLAASQGWDVPAGVDISYNTTIPRGVGLAGSSALVIALLRCLLDLIDETLEDHLVASLALSVEVDQLGIGAGLQDRVIQSMGGLVAMDFGEMFTDARTGLAYGAYEALDPSSLPNLFVAYSLDAAEPSSHYHSILRQRFDRKEPPTVDGLAELAGLVLRGKAALRWGGGGLAPLLRRNMELRSGLAPVSEAQLALVGAATDVGLSTTFTGSGGAIVGVFDSDDQLHELARLLPDPEAVVRPLSVFGPEVFDA